MTGLPLVVDDGGRADAGFKGSAGDCVTRAIAIATGTPYADVYADLHERAQRHQATSRRRADRTRTGRPRSASPRDGVARAVFHPWLLEHGWTWTPTMAIGSGTTVHLAVGELPAGRLIVRCSKHVVAVLDGVVHDTHDPTRDGTRAVYGYYTAPDSTPGEECATDDVTPTTPPDAATGPAVSVRWHRVPELGYRARLLTDACRLVSLHVHGGHGAPWVADVLMRARVVATSQHLRKADAQAQALVDAAWLIERLRRGSTMPPTGYECSVVSVPSVETCAPPPSTPGSMTSGSA